MKNNGFRKHFTFFFFASSLLLGVVILLLSTVITDRPVGVAGTLILGTCYGFFLIYPIVLTALNLVFLVKRPKRAEMIEKGKQTEIITLGLGGIFTLLLVAASDIVFQADWEEVLYNGQLHTPIWTESYATIITISVIAVIGYLFLASFKVHSVPPLLTVCAMAAMYMGMILSILWIAQIFSLDSLGWLLCLFPFNCIAIAVKTVRDKVFEWKEVQLTEAKTFQNKYLNMLNRKLMNSEGWPIAAFLIMLPILGIIICILVLFGQQPDSIIKAWTETSDWNLSKRVAPQNLTYDEHYLCTVAAGGHDKIVKPIRMGERHGHAVVVNRQLCIANAFEQVLEERVPVFHRHLRNFYDRYGLPVARLIHSPYAADGIYMLMKPLEWFFLLVLYCCDVNPENRIAVQYLPSEKSSCLNHQCREKSQSGNGDKLC